MFRKFDSARCRWEGVAPRVYKDDTSVFRNVTKQVLFEREGDLPVQFRYFQVEPGDGPLSSAMSICTWW